MTAAPRRPAVFLDRDGTLIEDVGYLDRFERLAVMPWAAEALKALRSAGFALVMVTNQSGVAQGMIEESFVVDVHRFLADQFAEAGAPFDGIYYCPHHPSGSVEAFRRDCDCRKPRPGMALQAERELGLDLARSFVVGDKWLDVGLGNAIGGGGILVRTGYGGSEERRPKPGITPVAIVDTVLDAASFIIRTTRR